MKYIRSEKYNTPALQKKMMGPNPVKLEEELLLNHRIPEKAVVCDLGSGEGLTSVFLAKEYGFTVYAADLWSDPRENRKFFDAMGLKQEQIIPVKADASDLPFEKDFFDAVVSVDSYNYFGRDERYLDDKLLPFVKSGGFIYIAIPGMKKRLSRPFAPRAFAFLDAGADGLYARYRILEQDGGQVQGSKGSFRQGNGEQRGGLGRLAQAGK